MSKHVKVLFFAMLKEITGVREAAIELPDETSIHELRIIVANKFPGLRSEFQNSLAAINGEYAAEGEIVGDNVEVAFFPRVSGGDGAAVTICRIQNGELAVDEILSAINQPTTGAICSFSGIVRAVTWQDNELITEFLEYDAYTSMAEAKMYQIAQEIRERWPSIDSIVIIQRTGMIKTGELSVVIACGAAHRNTGVFDAVHYGIDRLKEIVPVWKREWGPDGQMWVEGTYTPKPGE